MRNPRSLLITGASSGIGAALAREFAASGVFLALSGRDGGRLETVASDCRAAGAVVEARVVDVTDDAAMARWIAEVDDVHPLDLVVANAGVAGGKASGPAETAAAVRAIFAVNVTGVVNTVLPVLPRLQGRGRGHVAIMSSVAGFFGVPVAPAYSASKVAVKAWGEALRPGLAGDGVEVSVICPGYVASRITAANDFPMPFFMTAERAARIIRRGIERNTARIAFPWPMVALMRAASWLPGGAWRRAVRRLPGKV